MTLPRRSHRRRAATVAAAVVAVAALASAGSLVDHRSAGTVPALVAAREEALHGGASTGEGPWPCVGGQRGTTVHRVSVPAPSNARAGALVVTPPGASADAPVVYLLHGYPDGPGSPLDAGLACFTRGSSHRWPPFVLAIPDGTGWRRGDHEWADAADGTDQVET